MSYQNYMKQALNDVYKKKQQQPTQGYGQQQYNYGGYAGATKSYLPENYAQPTQAPTMSQNFMDPWTQGQPYIMQNQPRTYPQQPSSVTDMPNLSNLQQIMNPVSYTHLTLPTILLV